MAPLSLLLLVLSTVLTEAAVLGEPLLTSGNLNRVQSPSVATAEVTATQTAEITAAQTAEVSATQTADTVTSTASVETTTIHGAVPSVKVVVEASSSSVEATVETGAPSVAARLTVPPPILTALSDSPPSVAETQTLLSIEAEGLISRPPETIEVNNLPETQTGPSTPLSPPGESLMFKIIGTEERTNDYEAPQAYKEHPPTPQIPIPPTPRIQRASTPRIPIEPSPRIPIELTPRIPRAPTPRIPIEPTPRIPIELTPRIPRAPTPRMLRALAQRIPRVTRPPTQVTPTPSTPSTLASIHASTSSQAPTEITSTHTSTEITSTATTSFPPTARSSTPSSTPLSSSSSVLSDSIHDMMVSDGEKGELLQNHLPKLPHLLQEHKVLIEVLDALNKKMDNVTLALAWHFTTTDTRVAEAQERDNLTRQLLQRLNQLNLSLPTQENGQLLQENRRLRDERNRAEEERNRAEEERNRVENQVAEVSNQFDRAVLEIEKVNKELEDVRSGMERELNHTRRHGEELERENEEQREINRKTGEEKRRLEERLVEMENLNRIIEGNVTKLEEESEERERRIRETQAEKQQIEAKNRLMATELQGCKRNVSSLVQRPSAPRDCAEVYCSGVRTDGVYTVAPYSNSPRLVTVWCDMTSEGGGWTVFLRRTRIGRHLNFSRDWEDYKEGFGRVWAEHWLGLEPLHHLSYQGGPNHLRLAVTNLKGVHHSAQWHTFAVQGEQTDYELEVGSYDQGGSTLGDALVTHHNLSGQKFSTRDRDNDQLAGGECVKEFSMGGGWWYYRCAFLSPTGPHAGSGKHMISLFTPGNFTWVSVERLVMMIRPANFPQC